VIPETETGRDVRAFQVGDGVAGGGVNQEADDRAERNLIGNAADFGVVVERYPRGRLPRPKVNRHLPLAPLAGSTTPPK
jgi:hypothetical protein